MSDEPTPDLLLALEATFPKLDNALKQKELGESLTVALEICTEMEREVPRMEAMIQTVEILQKYTEDHKIGLRRILVDLEELGADMEAAKDAEQLDGVAKSASDFRKWIVFLHTTALQIAKLYCRDEVDPLKPLQNLMSKIGQEQLSKKITEVLQTAEALDRASTKLPNEIKALQIQVKQLSGAISELAGDPEIDQFLRTYAREGEVPLRIVTTKILDWLGRNDALDSFVLRGQ